MRFRPANISLINRRHYLPRLLLTLSSKYENENHPTDLQLLTGSHHINFRIAHNPLRARTNLWLHYSLVDRRESVVEDAGDSAAGVCGRGELLPVYTALNLWNMIHDSHVLNRLGLVQYDRWISYVLLIALAFVAHHFVEKPAQRVLRRWMHVWR